MAKKRKSLTDFMKKYYQVIEENKDKEEWKDVELGDYPIYEISNYGLVRRKDNKYVINPFHSYRKDKDGNFIKNRPTYLRVQLYYYKNGIRYKKHMEISRLVALSFIPIPEKYIKEGLNSDDLQVNHINGGYNIYDNSVNNLEWCTNKENIDKAFETGLRHPPKGEQHHYTFLNEKEVIRICKCIQKGLGVKKTYNKYKSFKKYDYKTKFKPTFYSIKYKRSWKFISQYYF